MSDVNVNDAKVSEADVRRYIDTFGKDDQYGNVLMPNYCSQVVSGSECPIDPRFNSRYPSCSRFVSPGDTLCSDWASNPQYKDSVEKTQVNFCMVNKTRDCKCISRLPQFGNQNKEDCDTSYLNEPNDSDDFQKLASNIPTDDTCWYKPCSNPHQFIVRPTDLESRKACGDSSQQNGGDVDCQDFNDFAASSRGGQIVRKFESDIRCNINGPLQSRGTGSTTKLISNDPSLPPQGRSGSGDFYDDRRIFIIAFIILVVVILMIAFFVHSDNIRSSKTRNTVRVARIGQASVPMMSGPAVITTMS